MYEPSTGIPESMQHYLRMWNERDPSNIDGYCRRYRYDRIIQAAGEPLARDAARWPRPYRTGRRLLRRTREGMTSIGIPNKHVHETTPATTKRLAHVR